MLLIAQMTGQLRMQAGLQHPLHQLRQKPALPGQLHPAFINPVHQLIQEPLVEELINRLLRRPLRTVSPRHNVHPVPRFLRSVYTDNLIPPGRGLCPHYAYAADPHGYVERGRTERRHRRVGLRPAPDTMAVLSGYLPVEQGVSCLAALRRHADTVKADGDPRSRDQIMADTLVERVTGQAAAADVNIELHLLMPLTSLLDPHSPTPAEIAGYGPIPAGTALDLLRSSRGRRWWRRLFTAPAGGPIIGSDGFRRRFNDSLGSPIRLRDRTCRDPYCDAPIRHLDHVHRHADGGPSTLANGRGLCARGNYVRETPGWTATVTNDGRHSHPHTVTITTPTGHTYTSSAPQPP